MCVVGYQSEFNFIEELIIEKGDLQAKRGNTYRKTSVVVVYTQIWITVKQWSQKPAVESLYVGPMKWLSHLHIEQPAHRIWSC